MKIIVQAKTNSKKEGVEKTSEDIYIVRVNTPPIEGKANNRIIALLSKHFKVPKSKIWLIRGEKSKNKYFEIELT
tara:strand:+ start:149603 stop:149827 length:225 start_codon:yes stop_codon:yes gene_type:complete